MSIPNEFFRELRGALNFTHSEAGSPPPEFSAEQAAAIRELLYPKAALYISRKSIEDLIKEGRPVVIQGKEWRPARIYITQGLMYDQELPPEAAQDETFEALKRKQYLKHYFGISVEDFEAGAKKAAEAFKAMATAAQMKTNQCEDPCSGKCGDIKVTQNRNLSNDHAGAVSKAHAEQVSQASGFREGGILYGAVKRSDDAFHTKSQDGSAIAEVPKDAEQRRIQENHAQSVAMAAGGPYKGGFVIEPAKMTNVRLGYTELANVLALALEQAQNGKGNARHQVGATPFLSQPICELARLYGVGYNFGQAAKKAHETQQLDSKQAKLNELLGAINYLAAAYLVIAEQE
ncbi:hypothetical protein EAb13_CDS0089 [Acinetobacter phage EAb13]|nr:hypothetical protein EAb13_CDS0089 [Acinetobacter phage EAb13]